MAPTPLGDVVDAISEVARMSKLALLKKMYRDIDEFVQFVFSFKVKYVQKID